MTTRPQELKTVKEGFLETKTVKDFMTSNPEIISPQTTIKEAADKMAELNTGSLPVGNDEKLIGFITDRDIVVRAIAEGLSETTTIDKIMTDKVLYCYEDNDLEDVAKNMKDNEVLRLVVLDHDKNLTGVVTHSQLAKAAIANDNMNLCKKVTELACYNKVF